MCCDLYSSYPFLVVEPLSRIFFGLYLMLLRAVRFDFLS